MYNLQNTLQECANELDDLGIEYGNVVNIESDKRATNRWGQTLKRWDGNYEIKISNTLLNQKNPFASLKKVVMHELLHTCDGCMSHTGKWKEYANKVNKAYGYNIKNGECIEDLNLAEDDRPIKIKHSFRCENCGQIINRQRESNFTKHTNLYRCACGGKFERLF